MIPSMFCCIMYSILPLDTSARALRYVLAIVLCVVAHQAPGSMNALVLCSDPEVIPNPASEIGEVECAFRSNVHGTEVLVPPGVAVKQRQHLQSLMVKANVTTISTLHRNSHYIGCCRLDGIPCQQRNLIAYYVTTQARN
eukprot:752166-Hanusia_phi.AAC.3